MLTDTKIKNAKPRAKPFKLYDGDGLYLLVKPGGSKGWRFKYRFSSKEKLLSMGRYPATSLSAARGKRDTARELLDRDPPVDPSDDRQARKAAAADSFRVVASEWFAAKRAKWGALTRERNQFLSDRLNEHLGPRPMAKLETLTIKRAVVAIQKKHGAETARRALGMARRIFRYAIAHGKAERDATAGLEEVLHARKKGHRAAVIDGKKIEDQKPAVGTLLRAIDSFKGQATTRAFLQLLALNFPRPTELRLATWDEIDLDAAVWEIPPDRMKKVGEDTPESHLLPLAAQSVEILRELNTITGKSPWVFPTLDPKKPISENAGNNALAKLGYKGLHTCHGFRAVARTMLDEQLSFRTDWIEKQLGHAVKDPNGQAYNRTKYLEERRKMLQQWANYLDQLREGNSGNVVPIKASA